MHITLSSDYQDWQLTLQVRKLVENIHYCYNESLYDA